MERMAAVEGACVSAPVKSTTIELGVVLVGEHNFDTPRPCHPHVLLKRLPDLAHKGVLIEVQEHCTGHA